MRRGRDGCHAFVGGRCVWCVAGMQPDAAGVGVASAACAVSVDGYCLRCAESHFARGGVCDACVLDCTTCISAAESIACGDGFFLRNGTCVANSVAYEGCTQVMVSWGCIHCEDGYFLRVKKCRELATCRTRNTGGACLSNGKCRSQTAWWSIPLVIVTATLVATGLAIFAVHFFI